MHCQGTISLNQAGGCHLQWWITHDLSCISLVLWDHLLGAASKGYLKKQKQAKNLVINPKKLKTLSHSTSLPGHQLFKEIGSVVLRFPDFLNLLIVLSINLILYHLTSLIDSFQVQHFEQEYRLYSVLQVIKLQTVNNTWMPYL